MLMGATIAQLREYAKANGMKGFTTLSKADLIEFIKRNMPENNEDIKVKEPKKRGRKPKSESIPNQAENEQASMTRDVDAKEELKRNLSENEENKSENVENKNYKLHMRDKSNYSEQVSNSYVPRNPNKLNRNYYSNTALPDILNSNECGEATGILEMHSDGYGFLRTDRFMENSRDVYVSIAQIRRFNLRSGDKVSGKTRPVSYTHLTLPTTIRV